MVERAGVRLSGGGGIGWDIGVVYEMLIGRRESGRHASTRISPSPIY